LIAVLRDRDRSGYRPRAQCLQAYERRARAEGIAKKIAKSDNLIKLFHGMRRSSLPVIASNHQGNPEKKRNDVEKIILGNQVFTITSL
jgi:hypothetical protein